MSHYFVIVENEVYQTDVCQGYVCGTLGPFRKQEGHGTQKTQAIRPERMRWLTKDYSFFQTAQTQNSIGK